MFDDTNIYFACRCWDQHPERIVANDMRRDSSNLRQNDNFAVELDTFHDRRNGFLFYVTPVGGMFDGATTDERINNADWNTVWEAKTSRFARRLDRRDRDPVQVAALRARARADLGHQPAPHDPRQERIRLHHADEAARGGSSRSSARRRPRRWSGSRCRRPAMNLEIKPYAISRLTTDLLASPAAAQRLRPGRRPRREVRHHQEPDRRLHLQHRLRAGRGRRGAGEPDAVQPAVPGEARVLPRRAGHCSRSAASAARPAAARREQRRRRRATRRRFSTAGASVSRADAPVPIIGGGRLSGTRGAVDRRRAQHHERPTTMRRSAAQHQLHRAAAAARRAAAQHHRRAVHRADRSSTVGAGRQRGLPASTATSPSSRTCTSAATSRKSRTEGREGERPQLSRRSSTTPPTATASSSIASWSPQNFNPEVGFLPRDELPAQLRVGAASARGRRSNATIRKYYFDGSFNYTTDNDNHLESRQALGAFRIELQNSDAFHVEYFERLRVPAAAVPGRGHGVRIPVGGYDFSHVRMAYSPGQQHRLSGTAAVDVGSFYDGDQEDGVAPRRGSASRRSSASSRTSR